MARMVWRLSLVLRVSGSPGLQVSGFPNFWISEPLGLRASGPPSFWFSESVGLWNCWLPLRRLSVADTKWAASASGSPATVGSRRISRSIPLETARLAGGPTSISIIMASTSSPNCAVLCPRPPAPRGGEKGRRGRGVRKSGDRGGFRAGRGSGLTACRPS